MMMCYGFDYTDDFYCVEFQIIIYFIIVLLFISYFLLFVIALQSLLNSALNSLGEPGYLWENQTKGLGKNLECL